LLGLMLAGGVPAHAADEALPAPAEGPPAAPPPPAVLNLWDCRRIALEKQPAVRAARASLAFAQARAAAVENLAVPAAIKHDLPIRRQQAALGVRVAQALVCQAEWDTLYNVTRNYISALYAQDQRQVADRAIQELKKFQNDPALPVVDWQVKQAGVYMAIARGRREAAVSGYQEARAALREAMGVGPDFCFELADSGLRDLDVPACRNDILALALARRGELVAASTLAQVVCLEADAQGLTHHPVAQTFAATADLHAQPVPTGLRDGIYRPAALAVEMPTQLVGSRTERVTQAQALSARAQEVVDKVRNLIALETDDAYARWAEASRQVKEFGEALSKSKALVEDVRQSAQPPKNTATTLDVFNVNLLSRHTQLEYNTARYNLYLGLAAFERITAGGFCPGFERGLAAPAPPAPAPAEAPEPSP
ncbi:MAG TPA: TolC family protein, partial [Gemmataceae bacterium]|nr:TolC family protein [Gemmataceae bacterium]